MAFNGNEYIVYARTGSGTPKAFQALVCLTSNGFQPEDNQIDTGSKCTGDWNTTIPGRKGWSISGEGQLLKVPGAGEVSYKQLLTLWKSGEVFEVMIAAKDDPADVEVRGQARISDIPLTYPDNEVSTFSVTFTGQGEPFFEAEA